MGKVHKDKKTDMVSCRTCRNYYITHDPRAPYGCRALGFKSRRNPAAVVYESSGIHCQLYRHKKNKYSGGSGGGRVA